MVQHMTEMRSTFGALKLFTFNCEVPFEVLTKSDTNFSHLVVYKMMPYAYCGLKGIIFESQSHLPSIFK